MFEGANQKIIKQLKNEKNNLAMIEFDLQKA